MSLYIGFNPVKANNEYLKMICNLYNHDRYWIAAHYDSHLTLKGTYDNCEYDSFAWCSEPGFADSIHIFGVNTIDELQARYPHLYIIRNNTLYPVCVIFANKQQKEIRKLVKLANNNLKTIKNIKHH